MANMNVPGGYVPGAAYEDAYYQRTERRDNKPSPKVPGNQGSKPPAGHREENATVTISKEAREQQNRTHFPNINDPNDHGFITKAWDENGNVVYDASWDKNEMPKEPRQDNTTHFSNINDPNDHGFFTKIWDEDGNVVWDASWKNDVEQPKPEPGMPPHGKPNSGQLPHWTEISRDLAENGFYKNMTRQEIDYLEGYLRSMRTADDLNAFADKHTSGNLRQYLKDLAKEFGIHDKVNPAPQAGKPPHGAPKAGQLPHWTEISKDLAEHGFYKNMTSQEVDYLEGFLRSMRSVKDLNIFADKHTSGNLREFLKELAKGFENAGRGHRR